MIDMQKQKKIKVIVVPMSDARAFTEQRSVGLLNEDNPIPVTSYRKIAERTLKG